MPSLIMTNLIKKIQGKNNVVNALKTDIDKLQKIPRTIFDDKVSYIELLKKANDFSSGQNSLNGSNNNQDSLFSDLSKEFMNVNVDKDRLKTYIDVKVLTSKIPVLKKAINLYVGNILSPDDITKQSLRVVLNDDANIEMNEDYSIIIDEYKNIIKSTKLENRIKNLISETLKYGDQFVEISTIPERFSRAIQNNDHFGNLNETYSKEVKVVALDEKLKKEKIIRNCKVIFEERDNYDNSDTVVNNRYITEDLNPELLDSILTEYDNDMDNFLYEQELLTEIETDVEMKKAAFDRMRNLTLPDYIRRRQEEDPDFANKYDSINNLPDNYKVAQLIVEPVPINQVVVLHKGEWILGYLYIYTNNDNNGGDTNSALQYMGGGGETINTLGANGGFSGTSSSSSGSAASTFGNSSSSSTIQNFGGDSSNNPFSPDGNYPDEKAASDTLINLVYKAAIEYLDNTKNIKDIPDELKLVISKVLEMNNTNIRIRFIPENNMQHFKIDSLDTTPYGESLFSSLIFTLKLYLTKMIASTIYKLARAGSHLVYNIDITNTRDAKNRIEQVKRAVRKKEISVDKLNVETISGIISTLDDIFVPMKDGKKWVEIDKLDLGDMNTDNGEEEKNFLKSVLTGLDIPPSLLGVEEYNSAKATLSQESAVFARVVIDYQKIFSDQLTSLVTKLYEIVHGKTLPNRLHEDIIVTFLPPRGLMAENLSKMYGDLDGLINKLKKQGVPEDMLKRKYLSEFDWDEIMAEQIEEKALKKKKKKDGEGGDDGGLGDLDMGGLGGDFDMGGDDLGGDAGGLDAELDTEMPM